MADLAAVEASLVARIANILYPEGTGLPSAIGAPVRLYRGWPDPDALTRDLAAGTCHVTIFARGGVSSVAADALTRWEPETAPAASLTAAVDEAAATVTFGGDATVPRMIVGVVADQVGAWTHAVAASDTPASVAASLAFAISQDRPASAAGAVLTVPDAVRLTVRIGVGATARRRVRTQRQGIQVSLWCPRPNLRDLLAGVVDTALAEQPRLALPRGERALMNYDGTMSDDDTRNQPLYRRDVLLTVEYATVVERRFVPAVVSPRRVEAV